MGASYGSRPEYETRSFALADPSWGSLQSLRECQKIESQEMRVFTVGSSRVPTRTSADAPENHFSGTCRKLHAKEEEKLSGVKQYLLVLLAYSPMNPIGKR